MQRRDFLRNGLLLASAGLLSGEGFFLSILETASSENAELEVSKQFIHAIFEKKVDVVEAIIRNGADVNINCGYGFTPLHLAVWRENLEIVQILVVNGADVNAKDEFGGTPLHQTITNESVEVIKVLVANGADVNIKDEYGVAPLDLAIARENAPIIEYLSSIVNCHV